MAIPSLMEMLTRAVGPVGVILRVERNEAVVAGGGDTGNQDGAVESINLIHHLRHRPRVPNRTWCSRCSTSDCFQTGTASRRGPAAAGRQDPEPAGRIATRCDRAR